ncbi:MAG: hypothetical protein CVT88_06795 [Candidatus Altiarchaeales archaeon HGW-Altiarchaeales-1]|nr:MAG: hypothetical protein CVT88_06795 [Candidatus Altiarchaeales archaeon HGW-Altiarchaeales-1]
MNNVANLSEDLEQIKTIFFDTAPIIYYIEANPIFGHLAKEVMDKVQSGELIAFSSVITLTEVLPKPINMGKKDLADRFVKFLKNGKNFNLMEISVNIGEKAGRLRGKYPALRSMDAIQISAALNAKADIFLTNDNKLKQIKEIKVIVLKDYLKNE